MSSKSARPTRLLLTTFSQPHISGDFQSHPRFIKTRRGSEGGYKLAQSVSDISLASIIRLMDGALAATDSVSRYFYSETPLEKEEKVIEVLRDIRDYISNRLESLKLSDLI